MKTKLIAYNIAELENRHLLSAAKHLFDSQIIDQSQWDEVRKTYHSSLYSPSIFMRLLLFIFAYIGLSTIVSPIAMIFSFGGEVGYRILGILVGVGILLLNDIVLIQRKLHYKSGVTEASIFSGLSLLAFGILGFDTDSIYAYLVVGLLFAMFATIRYLNITAMLLSLFFAGWILFRILYDISDTTKALIPIIFFIIFGSLYFTVKKHESKLKSIVFENHIIVLKSVALFVTYLSVNYYVVRELSVALMGVELTSGQDIPMAFLFYLFTALLPIVYIIWGYKCQSTLIIRVGLAIFALSAITFKYYFSLNHPALTATISGGLLIIIALFLLNYLKTMRNGFSRELLIKDKWNSQEITAIIASQTLGGNKAASDDFDFGGGSFGGGGAGQNW